MSYAFVVIPFKVTRGAGRNTQVDSEAVPAGDLHEVERLRKEYVTGITNLAKALSDRRRAEGAFATAKDHEAACSMLLTTSSNYICALFALVERFPIVGVMYYYYWSSSVAPEQFMGYDDYRYDAACVYFNLATFLLNLAQYFMSVRANAGNVLALETESYRMLLRAAGYYELVQRITQTIKATPIGVAPFPVFPEVSVALLNLFQNLCLAQAQEIGVTRAVAADKKIEKEQTVRLCHQLLDLYETCKTQAHAVGIQTEVLTKLTTFATVKCDIFRTLLYCHAATCTFNRSPTDGLRLMQDAKQYGTEVQKHYKLAQKGRLPFHMEALLEGCGVTLRRMEERLVKINSMVHHAKPNAATVLLPPPLVLAQCVPVDLPLPIPEAAPPPPPSPSP